ncbi:glycosyltransferase family 4 protein [Methanococcus maripaludis]|uniref:Glycosyltransferase involved in cell wall biosynthesis n=2 Tax=Methanococcus maripaludis TaxID=39152 RepID=A0A7J9PIS6_METMI|nr:glycosyltransferase family 4 protein [Methanococcus maripaludis]MBA2862577.1 glycosyltransferase involved in cell wall biosynthesis [Methanococcus maripaludis]
MKILLPSIYYPFIGGISIHVENLIKNLNKIDSFEFHILNYNFDVTIENSFENVTVHKIPYFSKLRGPSYILNGYKLGKKIIKNEKIDLIHSHYAAPQGFLGAVLGKKCNIPTVLTLHGSDVLNLSKNTFGKYFFEYALNNSEKIICVSEFLKTNLKTNFNIDSNVIYNGFDEELFNPSNNDCDYGLFVGSLVEQKGIFYFLESIKNIDFTFKIIGNGPLYNKILDFIKLNEIKNVELLGPKTQAEVSEYLKNCSFLILPSVSEGLGMSIIEAMACKKAVIGTDVGGIPELIKDGINGYIVYPKDTKVLEDRINMLVYNKNLRKSLGEEGLNYSKNFSWRYSAKKTYEIYNSLLTE